MRHLGTLITAIIVAPLAWVLLAIGQQRSVAAFSGDLQPAEFVRPLLVLAAAGLLLGVLGTLRFSPLGAMAIGIVYIFSNTMLLASPSTVMRVFTDDLHVAGRHIDLTAPIRTGTTMVLGVLLLVGATSVQRWRRWPRPAGDGAPATGVEDRPLGVDGLGLDIPQQDTEPEPSVRYVTSPDPYATSRRGTSASDAPYGW
ncbi:hypothetical protein OHA72_57695 [Dactylosporangium sp. NBC_01737]|uniref:hypothetical protein n=1 Tax=Dactylosporangium sp. NBC_01737 TaxID=2975959 RepID=UPI002E13B7C4|nr:hypothetical protein OHA72_57695 [Dactylosporangium sp. NBC_01737]